MDKNEKLILSYSTLHNMLDDAQNDGLFAEGCCYDLNYDIDEEIKRNIESGDIKMVEDYNNGGYVSREEAKAAYCRKFCTQGAACPDYKCKEVNDAFDKIPSAHIEPRSAHWIINSDGYYPYCSSCKYEPKSGEMTRYCPDCGARMKG